MHAEKDKTADIMCIQCKIKNFRSSNRLSDLRSVFTVRHVASRSSKLDPMLLCFDEFFSGPESYQPHNKQVIYHITCKLPTL